MEAEVTYEERGDGEKPISANDKEPGGARRRLDLGESDTAIKMEILKPDEIEELNELPDDLTMEGPRSPATVTRNRSDRDKRLGHRRVREDGHTTYKKVQTSQIMGSIQLGIQHAVGGLASKPERDLLMQDFMTVETYNFPTMGSNHTPAHHFSEFRFKNYAPIAFRYFRELFGIQPDDFLISMCYAPMVELSNPGASGSIFYLTDDDEFIVKTVQHKEGEFLQKLLPGYYMNLNQNPRTLLPKFFGLYCYQVLGKNIRLVVMNNLLPSHVKMHEKYDLKGSTYKRKASKAEKGKESPTFKDLDFMELHPEGLYLEPDTYHAMIKTIQRDCRVLESFKIMDYSLLVGIHYLGMDRVSGESKVELQRSRSMRQRVMTHATPMESIQAHGEDEEDLPMGGVPAKSAKGDRLLLYVGIIDILQSYHLRKKLEHTWKAFIHDGDTVSVHRPDFYAERFQNFMASKVFKKVAGPGRASASKRRSVARPSRQETEFRLPLRPPIQDVKSFHTVESTSSTSGIASTTSGMGSYTSGFTGSANGVISSTNGSIAQTLVGSTVISSAEIEVEEVRHVTRILVKS